MTIGIDDEPDDGGGFGALDCEINGITEHGRHRFKVPLISEIAPNLWQGGCGRGLVLPGFINHVVSLYPWESYDYRHELDSKLAVAMYDRKDQILSQVPIIASWVNECRKTGPVLVHCQLGFNRSSLVTCTALMEDGFTAGEAIGLVREKRSPVCLCNPAFEEWLRSGGRKR